MTTSDRTSPYGTMVMPLRTAGLTSIVDAELQAKVAALVSTSRTLMASRRLLLAERALLIETRRRQLDAVRLADVPAPSPLVGA